MNRFAGKVAIVTGAGAGIGAAIAGRLAAEGAKIVLAGRTLSKVQAFAEVIGQAGGTAIAKATDVRDPEQIADMVQRAIDEFGQLDVLVNNAGTGMLSRIDDTTLDSWRSLYANDVESVFLCSKQAVPHLRRSGGNIVNIASISGTGGDYGMNVYNGAKAAVINYSKGLALDLAPDGVRVNAVSPGIIRTPAVETVLAAAEQHWNERVPLMRPGLGEEIAAAVAFLASSDASYVTGHNLVVDGGLTAHTGQPSLFKVFST